MKGGWRDADERPIVLWGPPGVGKSTVGPRLARRLGLRFDDSDAMLSRAHGQPAASLLRTRGEPAFRALEAASVRAVLAGPCVVVALGGGALLDDELRYEALASAWVLGLRAPIALLRARIEATRVEAPRPLLEHEGALEALVDARAERYAEAHASEDADDEPDAVAQRLAAALHTLRRERVVRVPLRGRSYSVHFDGLERFVARVGALGPGGTLAVLDGGALRAPTVQALAGQFAPEAMVTLGARPEAEKSLATVERIWDAALARGFDRKAMLLAIGGGATSDVTGFAAATLLRGVRYATAPTTLLAMADASVGGKTAVDHRRAKNLVGAVHQPSLVQCDLAALETLPVRSLRAGLAEVAKIALCVDEGLLARLERESDGLRRCELEAIERVLPAAVGAKARVVALDEHERSLRARLNFGHTVGHALEHASGYALEHGLCVALGMRAALDLGVTSGVTPPEVAREAAAFLDALAMPTALPEGARVSLDGACEALSFDKKRERDALRFVLLDGRGSSTLAPVARDDGLRVIERLLEIRAPNGTRVGSN